MIEFRGRWLTILAIVGLLVLWELLYYQGLIDSLRFSHPFAILQILGDSAFLQGLGVLLAQVGLTSLLGGLVGLALGSLIIRSAWLTQTSIRVLRFGLWVPFLVLWVDPIFSTFQQRNSAAGIAQVVTAIVFLLIPAVALSTCYDYLTVRFLLARDWRDTRSYVLRDSTLQALLISLLAQMSLSPYRWDWFEVTGPRGVAVAYAALIVLIVLLFLLDKVFRASFDSAAEVRGAIITTEVASRSWSSLWGSVLIGLGCLVLGLIAYFYPLISSPLDVLQAIYRLFVGTSISSTNETIWRHLGISIFEAFGGLLLAGGVALIVRRALFAGATFRNWAFPFLSLTYIAPIVLSVVLIVWAQPYGVYPWRIAVGVALLSFFPFMQVLWGLRERPLSFQILLAADEALPFAFVAMLFGEAFTSVVGLGFFMVVARAKLYIAESVAASLLTLALLIGLSSALRAVVKWRYFPART
ncbi:MAG: hypothetical protein HY694_01730 [Deltaproteobacteria bacterium]|nr:hypothetical protein [Deltaproteobacteria bacterium]